MREQRVLDALDLALARDDPRLDRFALRAFSTPRWLRWSVCFSEMLAFVALTVTGVALFTHVAVVVVGAGVAVAAGAGAELGRRSGGADCACGLRAAWRRVRLRRIRS